MGSKSKRGGGVTAPQRGTGGRKRNRVILRGQEDVSTPTLPQNLLEAQPLCTAGAMAGGTTANSLRCPLPPSDWAHLPESSPVHNSKDVLKDEHGVESYQVNIRLMGKGRCHIAGL